MTPLEGRMSQATTLTSFKWATVPIWPFSDGPREGPIKALPELFGILQTCGGVALMANAGAGQRAREGGHSVT